MACRAISEYDGKRLLAKWVTERSGGEHRVDLKAVRLTSADLVGPDAKAKQEQIISENPWVLTDKLVIKPDQLLKRRGKLGLVGLNLNFSAAVAWAAQRAGKPFTADGVTGELNTFIVEPFVPHAVEFYVAMMNTRDGETILFYHEGGVDVGDVDAKARKMDVSLGLEELHPGDISNTLLTELKDASVKEKVAGFIKTLHEVYRMLHFSYLEINPVVIANDGTLVPLDLAAKLDETAEFLCGNKWGEINFPAPFGRPMLEAERKVHELDEKTGASLKLTILNPNGRVWTMVAGGGASVVYADTVCDLGFGKELANYGEYSGDPSEEMTAEYARALLSVMTETVHPDGKVLIIGGGIANFTNVAATFQGIIRALREYASKLIRGGVKIWVRRGGPNYQAGLKMMRDLGTEIGVPISVYGPEENIVSIVPMALGLVKEDPSRAHQPAKSAESGDELSREPSPAVSAEPSPPASGATSPAKRFRQSPDAAVNGNGTSSHGLFTSHTKAIVFGLQERAVQGMLDFDNICGRPIPSVAAMVFPFAGDHLQKFYYGTGEKMVPVYKDLANAVKKHPDASVFINFASFRSGYSTTMEALQHSDVFKVITIIAEGIPEQQTRKLIREAERRGVLIIGPATVGGIVPGAIRLGNTGGMIDNIIAARLYRPGSVAYVSRSGGMSNELNNIISRHSDGVREGIAIGGDRYPGTRFIDHLLRYEADPHVKILCLLGEVGGTDEYDVIKAMEEKRITKPIVAWTIGTCASSFGFEVQFGHAGALAQKERETAVAKNQAFIKAGAFVPRSFASYGEVLEKVYKDLVAKGAIQPLIEPSIPKVPMDFQWAKRLGLVRKPAAFVTTISDDRGEELLYAGMPISKVMEEDMGIGGVLGLLWFKRRLPAYACKFIETVLMVTADHGPAVSGAHNTIVCARAGKGLVESLASGLLCIGPRFGGALDEAAQAFMKACDRGISARDWVNELKNNNELIMGIGHKVKSVNNPDKRVSIIVEYAKANFPATPVLDFALEVEKITTKKKANLILNVDGAIACAFVDMMRLCGAFTREEADEAVSLGTLNGLFVVGRSIGFVGHFLDQTRLKQGLYRHPVDDIAYSLPQTDL